MTVMNERLTRATGTTGADVPPPMPETEPEIRACAAIAIGKIRTPEARQVLQQAVDDKDLVVKNAVSRALREIGA